MVHNWFGIISTKIICLGLHAEYLGGDRKDLNTVGVFFLHEKKFRYICN